VCKSSLDELRSIEWVAVSWSAYTDTMTNRKILAPAAVSDNELRAEGIDPTARRFVPPLGLISAADISQWVGVEAVAGMISLHDAAEGAYGTWHQQDAGGQTVWVNATRMIVIETESQAETR
jgi:hypothetical protein